MSTLPYCTLPHYTLPHFVNSTILYPTTLCRPYQGAVGYVKGVISELLTNKIDLSLLVISKGLTQVSEGAPMVLDCRNSFLRKEKVDYAFCYTQDA